MDDSLYSFTCHGSKARHRQAPYTKTTKSSSDPCDLPDFPDPSDPAFPWCSTCLTDCFEYLETAWPTTASGDAGETVPASVRAGPPRPLLLSVPEESTSLQSDPSLAAEPVWAVQFGSSDSSVVHVLDGWNGASVTRSS